ncbi:MAG: cytochrome o ubiquinol oxidase subunit IV [Pseudomonadota bacterium]
MSHASGQTGANGDGHHAAHGSYKSYIVGFILSVILTVVPFWMVMSDIGDLQLKLGVIFTFGAAQILVHIHYFLHVDLKAEQGWQAMSLIFTGVILFIVVVGSLWVMYHLHSNMMPAHFGHDHGGHSAQIQQDSDRHGAHDHVSHASENHH